MSQPLTEEQLHEALQTCASEPVHVPGSIQPMGYLLAAEFSEGGIRQISENCPEIFDMPAQDLLGKTVKELLGRDIWHKINNLRGMPAFAKGRHLAGTWLRAGVPYSVHVSEGSGRCVIELEAALTGLESLTQPEDDQSMLIEQIEYCNDRSELFETSVEFLRHLSGFDRVSIIEFEPEGHGKVVAESRTNLLEPILGLCFPSHDFPAQARDLMKVIPLRLISDVAQTPVPLVSIGPEEPPLDMTYAVMRGVSPVHMQYLHNFGLGSTMTLTIMQKDHLWGLLSFHNVKPRVAGPDLRHLLLRFMTVFRLKLSLLLREHDLRISKDIDRLQADVKRELGQEGDLQLMIDRVGPSILEALDATGVVMTNGSEYFVSGDVPSSAVVAALLEKAQNEELDDLLETQLSQAFPEFADHLNGCAGALVTVYEKNRCLQVFRKEIGQSVSWAGSPSKDIELVEGNLRIQPRGSFATYLEEVKGKSKSWSQEDVHVMRLLWPLLNAAERSSFLADLTRQQKLMINELNHRVRNILSLVKSVSSQARRAGGSLESYSYALEARVHALAAAHDIGAGAANESVSVHQIINLEAEPFTKDRTGRVRVRGEDAHVKAEVAPIFALVIHELMTNAVKYGALSVDDAHVDIELQQNEIGMRLIWLERDGPPTVKPSSNGFGTTLIQQAIPYEMNGTAEIKFMPEGVEVALELPHSALGSSNAKPVGDFPAVSAVLDTVSVKSHSGLVMVVEDNFMIARDMRGRLNDAGFSNVEVIPSEERALSFLEETSPTFAVLDVHLGHGETSLKVANELLSRDIPFIFVTGFGEDHNLPPHLSGIDVLTKPVTSRDITIAIDKVDL